MKTLYQMLQSSDLQKKISHNNCQTTCLTIKQRKLAAATPQRFTRFSHFLWDFLKTDMEIWSWTTSYPSRSCHTFFQARNYGFFYLWIMNDYIYVAMFVNHKSEILLNCAVCIYIHNTFRPLKTKQLHIHFVTHIDVAARVRYVRQRVSLNGPQLSLWVFRCTCKL